MKYTLYQSPQPAASHAPSSETLHFLFRMPAGFPSPAADHIEEGLDLNVYLVRRKASTFMFTVAGDSMSGAGIMDRDKVVVDRSVLPQHGYIVVAVVGGEYTIKRLLKIDNRIELHPSNPKYRPIKLTGSDELQIWGVVTGVVRRYSLSG